MGAQTPLSNRHFKKLTREVNAALPGGGTPKPLRWSKVPMVFDVGDHPSRAKAVGVVPIMVTPTIHNIKVTKTLIDEGAGLNVISPEVFDQMPFTFYGNT